MRLRLPDRRAVDYQVLRNNFSWSDHIHRLLLTGAVIAWCEPRTVCDPACGDASILEAAYRLRKFEFAYLSDISRPAIEALTPSFPYKESVSDIHDAIEKVNVDLIVLTEVLEHLEDPDAVLRLARKHATRIVVSSPLIRGNRVDDNAEHLWQWDDAGYREMLANAGWEPDTFGSFIALKSNYYEFQIWSAR